MFLALLLLSTSLLYFIAETVAWPGRVLVTPHLLLGPLVMYLRDGGYLFCGWPSRSLSWNHTPLPHCPLPAQPHYPPWNKKTTEYSLVELVAVVVSVRRIMVEGDMRLSAVFILHYRRCSVGFSYLLGVLNLEDVLYTSASPAVVIHCGDGMGVSNAVDVGDASSHVPSLPSILRQRIHLTSRFFLVHSPSACRRAPSSIVVA